MARVFPFNIAYIGSGDAHKSSMEKEAERAMNLLAQGRELIQEDLDSATGFLRESCTIMTELYGKEAGECAEPYFYYAQALLEKAAHSTTTTASSLDYSDNDEGIQDKAKNGSTLQQALDAFQVARKIFKRKAEAEAATDFVAKARLVETLAHLAGCARLDHNYAMSIKYLTQCVRIIKDSVAPFDSKSWDWENDGTFDLADVANQKKIREDIDMFAVADRIFDLLSESQKSPSNFKPAEFGALVEDLQGIALLIQPMVDAIALELAKQEKDEADEEAYSS